MKIYLSRISGSVDNIEEFMKKVDDDVGLMSSLPRKLVDTWANFEVNQGFYGPFFAGCT